MTETDFQALEQVIISGMLLTREKTVANFGIAKSLDDKNDLNLASNALTEVDLFNQDLMLTHLYSHFPHLEVSVEERTDNPIEVQAKFYANKGKSNLCFTLDAIDGTYGYKHGIRDDFGMIAGIIQRTEGDLGEFVLGIMYYPMHNFFLVANSSGFFEVRDGIRTRLEKSSAPIPEREEYSAVFIHDKKRLQLDFDRFVNDTYSVNQAVLQIVRGEIPGFLTSNGHIYDHILGPWMLSRWGADVVHASGTPFGIVPFGDKFIDGKRITPRNTNGLLISGDKSHRIFAEYIKHHVR